MSDKLTTLAMTEDFLLSGVCIECRMPGMFSQK